MTTLPTGDLKLPIFLCISVWGILSFYDNRVLQLRLLIQHWQKTQFWKSKSSVGVAL